MITKKAIVQPANEIRKFNRFYTKQMGLLNPGYLNSAFSLTQIRIFYELTQGPQTTATELAKELDLDAGYLSRILKGFTKQGLIVKEPTSDGRQHYLTLTVKGHSAFAELQSMVHEQLLAMLQPLSSLNQNRLIEAMRTIEMLLGTSVKTNDPYILRPHQPGDIGWVIYRHGILYSQEYGWDGTFEALVAEIGAKFLRDFDPKYECSWIAERDGEILGNVFLIRKSKNVCQLRMLLVEPKARGLGIGARLVEECIRFARRIGYKKMELSTNKALTAARHIYTKAGFHMTGEKSEHLWGQNQVNESWEIDLSN